ncbi:Procollagen galactosyltransferase [Fasciola hepatica]|uniref:Procollagen galactosyltransferase n=1 Tax=Fasciola hepatica TaxID=6192 RepID=A0A4E0RDJ1_FASHE|nr:Procollagen galactosyltransferase [Fasciola hepatica]
MGRQHKTPHGGTQLNTKAKRLKQKVPTNSSSFSGSNNNDNNNNSHQGPNKPVTLTALQSPSIAGQVGATSETATDIPPSNHSSTVNMHSVLSMSVRFLLGLAICLIAQLVYTHSKRAESDRILLSPEPIINRTVVQDTDTRFEPEQRSNLRPSYELPPTVFIGVPVRNKGHSLPYFLHGLEIQDYPTDRLHLSFIVDNSIDDSLLVLSTWIEAVRSKYHGIELEVGNDLLENTKQWSEEHHRHFVQLRQKLLDAARHSWADFYLSIDADVILVNPKSILHLVEVSHNPDSSELPPILPVVAPLLNCTNSEYYSNFWGDMTEQGYYKRSDDYFDIQRRFKLGVFPVAMVHTMFLVNLHHFLTPLLQFYPPTDGYTGPIDDLILLARSAQVASVQYYIDNTQFYGYIAAPVEETDLEEIGSFVENWINRDVELFTHLRLQALIDQEEYSPILPSPHLTQIAENHLPTRSKLGLDEIYYINLLRRPDRRMKTEYFLDQLGVAAQHVVAVDGKELDLDNMKEMGVEQLKGYADPYHKRSLKFGEIGCFLSHYNLWKEMVERGFQRILILEDDVRFAPGFVRNLAEVIREADLHKPEWELLYIGRKRMSKNETRVPGTQKLAYPDYTYWTLGYLLKQSGAEKLLAQNPLKKMVAVDEFLPIMFNRHPQKAWLEAFGPRDLIALSAEPLLLEPQKYTGEQFYVSDTEDSGVVGIF